MELDYREAERFINFTEKHLTLGGSFAGQPYKMMEYQKEVARELFARDYATGIRPIRTYVLGVPRKNAKSIFGAAIALFMLIVDDTDANPVIISAAGDRKQAKLVFEEAKRMIQASPILSELCEVYRDEIRCPSTGGVYKVVSADAGLAHGLNPSTVIFDEYHIFKNSDLFVALNTGSAMRNQPLTLVISTAGWDLQGPFGQLYQKGRRIESGELEDPSFGFKWYGPNETEVFDPSDPEVWKRYNPAWDIMTQREFESAYKTMPESEFIRYRLNGWTATQDSWFPTGAWEGRHEERKLANDEQAVLGFDGAWKGDSTALVAVGIDSLHVETVAVWEADPDDPHWRTPVLEVLQAVRDYCYSHSVVEVVADPARWEAYLQDLSEEGLPIVEYPNTVARMVPATQSFYESVMDEMLTHDGNPTLDRHIANCVLKQDQRGARITKEYKASHKHIDAAVAAVMAHHRAKLFREQGVPEPEFLLL